MVLFLKNHYVVRQKFYFLFRRFSNIHVSGNVSEMLQMLYHYQILIQVGERKPHTESNKEKKVHFIYPIVSQVSIDGGQPLKLCCKAQGFDKVPTVSFTNTY